MKASKKKSLRVDVGVIASLGRDSIKDHTTAVIELVKNSYDAGATIVEVDIMTHLSEPYIRIADNGIGMTEKDIDKYWLRIGYSEKRKVKFYKNRRKTGEKGVGRLSADRLGAKLEMRSLTEGKYPIAINLDWKKFDQMGKNIQTIKFDFFNEGVEINLPKTKRSKDESTSGIELIITELRQKWTKKDFDSLYRELGMLISPYSNEVDFDILLKTGQDAKYEKIGPPAISKYYEVKLEAEFDPESAITTCTVWERVPGKGERVKKPKKKIALNQLVTNDEYDVDLEKISLGPVKVVIAYYPRTDEVLQGSNFNKTQLGTYLKSNAGIKLYRDNIRVKPYGEPNQPGGDWLNLGARFAQNPAGRSRDSHRIRPVQLVGAIFITRDENSKLNDSASREGLIQDDHFRLLFEYVRGCIRLVEASSHEIFIEEQKLTPDKAKAADFDMINRNLTEVNDELGEVAKILTKHNDSEIKIIGETVAALVEKITFASESIVALESQTRLYRGLATVGIASAVFGHETSIQISRMSNAINAAKACLMEEPPQTQDAMSFIDIAIESSDQVLAWGGFALDRIRKDKRDSVKAKISNIIEWPINDLRAAFDALSIEIDEDMDETIESTVYKIDIESIILNLLTNAYTACRQIKENRKVRISLLKERRNKRDGFSIVVSDSGPGVIENLRTIIWQPTFTTKTIKQGASEEGTGMGLAIINSIVDEMNGEKKVGTDPKLKGARFEIWLPILG